MKRSLSEQHQNELYLMKIYTKTGDTGQTSLWGGKRVTKSHIRIESYGTLDELNSHIGLVAAYPVNELRKTLLHRIMDRLFIIGSYLAADPDNEKVNASIPAFKQQDIDDLELAMDEMDTALPKMKYFILPGGSVEVAQAHIARTVCRRAERLVVALKDTEEVEPMVLIYLNRLSDYLFVLARKTGEEQSVAEIPWVPEK